MAALTIKFNYVQDYAVLLRKDFIKYVGTILVRKMPKDHVDDIIVRCKRTVSDFSKGTEDIRTLLFDLLDNIATTKLPNGKCKFFNAGYGLYENEKEIVLAIVNDEGNVAVKTPCFVEFLLSFDDQGEDFSIDDVIEMYEADIRDFVKRHPENFPLDIDYVQVSFWHL